MNLNAGWLALMLLASFDTQAAQVDCSSDNEFSIVDVFDPAAEITKRQAALQALESYAECSADGYYLGLLYRHGPDLPGNLLKRDTERARQLLLKSAEHGHLLAYADLAEMALKENQQREAMKWTQVYLYFLQSRDAFTGEDGSYERSGYNANLLVRAERAWKAMRPHLPRETIKIDLNEYLAGKDSATLSAINRSDAANARAGREAGELKIKSVRACGVTPSMDGVATYLLEVLPDGRVGRAVLENFSPQEKIGEELRSCATVYTYYPLGTEKSMTARVPVFSGFSGSRLRTRRKYR